MTKKIMYCIFTIVLVLSIYTASLQKEKEVETEITTTTFNLINESDYEVYLKNWLSNHNKLREERLLSNIGSPQSNIEVEYDYLKKVRRLFEAYNYDIKLIPIKQKDIHNRLQLTLVDAMYNLDRLMEGLLHSDNNLTKEGKLQLIESYAKITQIEQELKRKQ